MTQEVLKIASHKSFEVLIPLYFQEEVIGVRSPLTMEAKKYDLKRFLGWLAEKSGALPDVDEWMPIDTRTFLADMVRIGLKPATINRMLATLRAFSKWLVVKNVLRMDACKGVRDLQLAPMAPKAIRDRDWYRIMRTAEAVAMRPPKAYSQGHRNGALLAILNASGLRISEILNLKVSQLEGRRLRDVHCKGSKVRTVLITAEAADLVRDYVEHHRTDGSDFLFTNRYGQRLSRNGIGQALHQLASHASVNLSAGEKIELRPHLLRHRHAYKARSVHGDVFAAKRLGHSSLKHLERYAGLTEAEEQDLIERM